MRNVCVSHRLIHFVSSYVAYVAYIFLLVFAARISVLVFPTRNAEHVFAMVNDPFFGFSVFLVVKNPYDLRSQVRQVQMSKSRKKEKYVNWKWILRNLFCCCSNLKMTNK